MSQLCISSSKNYLRKSSNLLLLQHPDSAAKRGFLLTTTKTNSSSSLLCWRSFSSVSQQQKGNKSEKKGFEEKSVQDDILSMDIDELNLSPWRNLLIVSTTHTYIHTHHTPFVPNLFLFVLLLFFK